MISIELERVYIKNFKKLDEFEVNFVSDKSLHLIKGPNGSGKSSIIESIYTCLYGSKPGVTDKQVIQNGKKSCELELRLKINSETYTITRIIGNNNKLEINKEGIILSDKPSTSKNIIESLIPKFIFELSMLQIESKNEIKNLFKEIISNIVNLDQFIDNLKNMLTTINNECNKLYNDTTTLQLNQVNLNRQIDSIQKRREFLNDEITKWNNSIETVKNEIGGITLEYIIETNKQVNDELNKRYNEQISSYKENIYNITNQLNQLNTDKNNISTLLNNIVKDTKSSKQSIDNEYDSKISDLKTKIKLIERDIKYKEDTISDISKELDLDKCPVCKQVITEETKTKIHNDINNIKSDITGLENQIKVIYIDIRDLEIRRKDEIENLKESMTIKYNNLLEDQKLLEPDITKLEELIKLENNKISLVDKQVVYEQIISDFKLDKNIINNYQYYKEKFDIMNNYISNINNSKSELSYLDSEEVRINNELSVINTNKQSIENDIEKLEIDKSVLEYWNDTRLLRSILLTKLSYNINNLLKQKYKSLIHIEFEIDEKDIDVITTNLNGEKVKINDLSKGEFVIAALSIMCAFKDILASKYSFNWLFLDEFLDKLDQDNIVTIVEFIDELVDGHKMVVTHNSYAIELQNWDNVIDMQSGKVEVE